MLNPASPPERQHEPEFHPMAGPVTEPFDCGRDDQTRFLLDAAWDHHQRGWSTTYLMWYKGMLAGYVTLASSEIQLAPAERPEGAPFARLPAVKLAQMGVDTRFQGQGLGVDLVTYALVVALKQAEVLGCTYLILDAVPERVAWYRDKLGFEENSHAQGARRNDAKRNGRPVELVPVSMRYDLRRPGSRALTALPAPKPVGARAAAEVGPSGPAKVLAAVAAVGSFLVYKWWVPRKRGGDS